MSGPAVSGLWDPALQLQPVPIPGQTSPSFVIQKSGRETPRDKRPHLNPLVPRALSHSISWLSELLRKPELLSTSRCSSSLLSPCSGCVRVGIVLHPPGVAREHGRVGAGSGTCSRTRSLPRSQARPHPRAHLWNKRKQPPKVTFLLLPVLHKEEFKPVGWEMQFPASGRAGEPWKAAASREENQSL